MQKIYINLKYFRCCHEMALPMVQLLVFLIGRTKIYWGRRNTEIQDIFISAAAACVIFILTSWWKNALLWTWPWHSDIFSGRRSGKRVDLLLMLLAMRRYVILIAGPGIVIFGACCCCRERIMHLRGRSSSGGSLFTVVEILRVEALCREVRGASGIVEVVREALSETISFCCCWGTSWSNILLFSLWSWSIWCRCFSSLDRLCLTQSSAFATI